jgi:dTDP-4-dehydrorhamnose 3,5-epimerase-like enzyme
MAINQETVTDASRAIAFADDVRALYYQTQAMQEKIERVAAGQAAIAAGTIDARELRFVQLVGILISAEDITRVGALLPLLQTITTTLATDYADFISPGG